MICGNCGKEIPDMNYYQTPKGLELLQKKATLEKQIKEIEEQIKSQQEICPSCKTLIIRG